MYNMDTVMDAIKIAVVYKISDVMCMYMYDNIIMFIHAYTFLCADINIISVG